MLSENTAVKIDFYRAQKKINNVIAMWDITKISKSLLKAIFWAQFIPKLSRIIPLHASWQQQQHNLNHSKNFMQNFQLTSTQQHHHRSDVERVLAIQKSVMFMASKWKTNPLSHPPAFRWKMNFHNPLLLQKWGNF